MTTRLLERIPAQVRLVAYIAVSLLLLGITSYQAAEGNWMLAALTFLGSLQGVLAGANVQLPSNDLSEDPHERED